MKIREADINDKNRWDSFVDSEDGDFHLYFDWKQFYESRGDSFIPLMIESDSSQLLGIFVVVKQKKSFYSILESIPEGGGDFLIKNDLSDLEKHDIVCAFIKYVDLNYSQGCACLLIRERLAHFDKRYEVPAKARIDSGLVYRYNAVTGLPCTHILEAKKPFEEKHWNILPRQLKQKINKAVRSGITVIHDKELKYRDEFIVMLAENYKRHQNKRFINDETKIRIKTFKEKTRLYIALQNGQPIAGLLCQYTPLTCFLMKICSYTRNNGNAEQLCLKVAIEDACDNGYKHVDFGISTEENTKFYKERFKPTTVPVGTYEKTYSMFKYRLYQASMLRDIMRKDKLYLWNNRAKIAKIIFGVTFKKNI
jgi:hypothetical protein